MKKWRITGRRGGVDEKGQAFGEIDVVTKKGDFTLFYFLDASGLRLTGLRAHNITPSMLRAPLGEIRDYLAESFIGRPDLIAPVPLIGFEPSTLEEKEVMGELRRRADIAVEVLKEAHPQQSTGKRENRETKFAFADLYLTCVRIYDQKAIVGMERELQQREELDWYSADTLRTKVRRLREDDWLEKGQQGRAGGAPGPKMIEWVKENKPERVERLEELREKWFADLEKEQQCKDDAEGRQR